MRGLPSSQARDLNTITPTILSPSGIRLDSLDEDAVRALGQELGAAQAEHAITRRRMHREIRQQLTPEQQELFDQRGPINFGDLNQKQHDNTYSVFAESNGQLTQYLTATLSARYDNNSEFDNAVSYRGGLSWQLNNHYTLFTSYGSAVKTPTFTERFGFFPARGVSTSTGLPMRFNCALLWVWESMTEWSIGCWICGTIA